MMIDSDKYDRSLPLHCPTCGGTEFEAETDASQDDAGQIKCPSCGLTTTKDELIACNGEHIEAQIDEIKEELVKDIAKSLKDAFGGTKYLKIK